jgi:hypothetical protein
MAYIFKGSGKRWNELMASFVQHLMDRAREIPDQTWNWFNGLNREEWLVVLIVVCACGFVAMLGFRSNRL